MAFDIGVFELEKLEKYRRVFSDECNYENLSIRRLMQGYRLDEKTFNLDKDVKYNNYLYKLIKRAYNIPSNRPNRVKKMIKILATGKSNTRVTTYEIDAQIHAIKQIKRLNTDKWDDLELVDLFFKYPVLRNIAMELINIDYQIYVEWVKDIVKRLQRENLLGDNMKSIPSKKMIEEIEIKELFRI